MKISKKEFLIMRDNFLIYVGVQTHRSKIQKASNLYTLSNLKGVTSEMLLSLNFYMEKGIRTSRKKTVQWTVFLFTF